VGSSDGSAADEALFLDRGRAGSFGADAERYDRARPRYPAALIDSLIAGLPAEPRVLDVGCGTGLASQPFLDRGIPVFGLEPDVRMADLARRRGVTVEISTFEESTFEQWATSKREFDLLISGQAWHWVEPVAGISKAATVLRPGGRLALFWNVGDTPAALKSGFAAAYEQFAPGLDQYSIMLGHVDLRRIDGPLELLRESPAFTEERWQRFDNPVEYTTEEWLDVLFTHSDHSKLPDEVHQPLKAALGAAIDAAGGSFVMPYSTVAVLAHRT
jgi:SAM-dependent methyltransferase